MDGNYNLRNPAVKRLMREAQELKDPTEQFSAHPLDDNLFEWHFTIRGPADTDFSDGFYHGRIILPPEYPMKPPSIILLTPSGRFETNKKICLSISGYHPETWLPSWSLRTALLGIIGFLPSHGGGAIGSLDYTAEERKILAKKSQDWKCPNCGHIRDLVLPVTKLSQGLNQEAKEIAQQINLTGEKRKDEGEEGKGTKEADTPTEVETSTTKTPEVTTLPVVSTANTAIITTANTAIITTANTAIVTTANRATVTTATTSSYPVRMTYQLPPYNLAQSYPFPFPPFQRQPTSHQQQPTTFNPNLYPQQFMWPYQQNLYPSSNTPPQQFFNPSFASFPQMNASFPSHFVPPFSSLSTATTLSHTTLVTPTLQNVLTNVITVCSISISTTSKASTVCTTSVSSHQNKTTKASTLVTNVISSTSRQQSTTLTSKSITSQATLVHSVPASSSSSSTSSLLLSSSSSSSTSLSSSSSSLGNELRHRFIPATTTTASLSSLVSSTTVISSITNSTSIVSSTINTSPVTVTTAPRVTRTHTSAEPSRRSNYHTGSNFLDAVIDLCIIFILFCIFALLSRRVFYYF